MIIYKTHLLPYSIKCICLFTFHTLPVSHFIVPVDCLQYTFLCLFFYFPFFIRYED